MYKHIPAKAGKSETIPYLRHLIRAIIRLMPLAFMSFPLNHPRHAQAGRPRIDGTQ